MNWMIYKLALGKSSERFKASTLWANFLSFSRATIIPGKYLGVLTALFLLFSFGTPLEATNGEIPDSPSSILAGGDYMLDFSAGDPELYPRLFPSQISPPSGRASNPIAGADQATTVESLAPENMALGQVVPFIIEIKTDAGGACSDDCITIEAGWETETTNGGAFGYDPTVGSNGIYAAFVDGGDGSAVEIDTDATVTSFSGALVGSEIQGTFEICGIDPGETVILEIWLVLQSTIPPGIGGNVQSRLIDATTSGTCETGETINTGNQTVPLLRAREFFTSDVDISVTKSDSQDPVVQGDQLTYTLVVNNAGPSVANDVVLTDILDANTTFVSATITDTEGYIVNEAADCTISGSTFTCDLQFLNPGETITITITVDVSATAPTGNGGGTDCAPGTTYDLTNNVSVTTISDDTDSSNDSDCEPTDVDPACDIAISSVDTDDETCVDEGDGSITINATCTTCTSIEYSINGVDYFPSNVFNSLDDGAYTVYARDSGDPSCNATDNATINEGAPKDDAGFTYPATACINDASNPVATVTGLGGGTFSVNNGAMINSSTGELNLATTTAGVTYTITYLTNGPCPESSTQDIEIKAAPVVSITGDSEYCEGTGGVTLDAGAGFASYSWSPGGETTQMISGALAGTYSVTVTDGNGCSGTSPNFVVTENPNPTPVITGDDEYCEGTGGVMLDAGAGFDTYLWSPGGETTQTITATDGSYTVTVTDANGCSGTSPSFVVTENPNPTPIISGDNEYCEGTGGVMLDAGAGFDTYLWSPGNETTQTISGALAGTYSVTVTDDKGCTGTSANFVVTENPNPTPVITGDDEYCEGTGGVMLDAGAGFDTYLWSPGGETTQTITATDGSYTVTVTDANGCSGTSPSFVVTENPNPTPVISGPSSYCEGTGGVSLDAGAGFSSYLWSPGGETTQTISGAMAGTYSVTVTDAKGCTGTSANFDVTEDPSIVVTISGDNEYCEGTGGVTLDAGAGFASYSWSPGGETTQMISGALAGTYSVTVTDGNGCSGTSPDFTVTENPNPTPVITGDDEYCEGTGGVTLDAGAGFASYSWSPGGETTQMITALDGSYTVTVTDAKGCSGTSPSFVVTENPNPTPIISGDNEYCEGTGGVSLDAGAGFDTYLWSPGGETTQMISGATDGTYSVTVTDDKGCTGTSANFIVTENPNPTPVITGDDEYCEGTGGVTLDAGAGFASYSWSPGGETTQMITATDGSYTVTVTDAKGCSGTSPAFVVTETTSPSLTAQTPEICEDDRFSVDLTQFESSITSEAGTFSYAKLPNPGASELFISEYVEGSGFTKYIEIFNGTGATVDLSNYELRLYNNGNSTANLTTPLSGMLEDCETVVLRNSQATEYTGPAIVISAVNFNGDDAVELYNTNTASTVDIFGNIGEDPGAQWSDPVSGNNTANVTLRRKASVSAGVSTDPVTGFPTLGTEWDEYPNNDVSGLGTHEYGEEVLDPTDVAVEDGCVFVVNFLSNDGCEAKTTITYTILPSPTLVAQTPEICEDEAEDVDLTQYESAITSEAGTFSYAKLPNPGASELFISEYVEGSGFTKYIEIFNGTGATVDLSNYELRLYNNGNSTANLTTQLSGMLEDCETVVLRNSQATEYTGPAIVISAVNFNGDDAVELYNTNTASTVDIFGNIGEDPGAQWSDPVSGNNTANVTLRRKASVSAGITTDPVTGFPTLGTEWDEYPNNDVSGLGAHQYGEDLIDPTSVAVVDGDIFKVSFTNSAGCSASTSITFKVNQNDTTNVAATTCDPSMVGVRDTTFTNQFGCDSLVITTTTLLPSDTTNVAATTCDPSMVGVRDTTFTNQFGCDSLVITTTTLLPSDTTNIAAVTCDPQEEGVTQQTFTNQFGCDSVVITTTVLQVDEIVCDATNHSDDNGPIVSALNHAFWLENFPAAPGMQQNDRFIWVPNTGQFIEDVQAGTATITGQIVNKSDPNVIFDVNVLLVNKMDWATWSSLGRLYKHDNILNPVGNEYLNWYFFELDPSSTITGVPGSTYDGDVITLTHRPADMTYGPQLGIGANDIDDSYGFATWFFWSGTLAGRTYTHEAGDINIDLECEPSPCEDDEVVLAARALLEGPYSEAAGMMNDDLRSMLPLFEPYTGLGFTHVGPGGGESIDNAVLSVTGSDAIVDWVFVELRDAINNTQVIATRSALMQRDGDIVDLDGFSQLSFSGVTSGNYYVVIRHRNHLGMMSLNPIALSDISTVVDFTNGSTNTWGTQAQNDLGASGKKGMVCGNANSDGVVDALDRGIFWNFRSTSGYDLHDANCDGVTDALDRGAGWNNRSRSEQVPY